MRFIEDGDIFGHHASQIAEAVAEADIKAKRMGFWENFKYRVQYALVALAASAAALTAGRLIELAIR